MSLLSKSAILGASDLKHEDVPVPAWGGTVRIRTMTGEERDEFRASIATGGDAGVPVGKFSAALLVATCVDENGDRLFSAEDMAALHAKSGSSLDAPAAVAMRLNGLIDGAVEAAEKNSVSGQSGDSGSGLPKS